MIRSANPADAAAICGIYNYYVLNTSVTFEAEAVTESEMATRIAETVAVLPWILWEEEGEVAGYAYASKWKGRCAYRYSVESTVYLRNDKRGRGIGRKLYAHLLNDLRRAGMHAVIGGIALPNAASQRLHESLAFKKVAHFDQVGWKFDQWIDVGYWELILTPDASVQASKPMAAVRPPGACS
jgi:phosphinothricin acetyltransferase